MGAQGSKILTQKREFSDESCSQMTKIDENPHESPTVTADRAAALTLSLDVQTALRSHLPSVAEHAVAAIIVEVPVYAAARSFMVDNIEAAVQMALGSFLTLAARSGDASTPLRPAQRGSYELGRGEARSGRSVDALLAAYRVGARVSWRQLSAVAVEAGMDASQLAQFAELVFAYIDELSAASVAGHADELETSERLQRQHRDRLALELLRGASEEVLLRRLDRARWEKPSTITALLTRETELHGIRGLVDPRSLVLAEDLPDVTAEENTAALLVPDLSPGARTKLLRAIGTRPVVVGPTRPWLLTAGSYRRALRAHRLLRDAGSGAQAAYDTERHLADLVRAADPEALADLRRMALAPLDDLTEVAREKLEETLRLWLLHRGRREAVAEALFVHQQTVRYRVGQLRDLFGDDLDDPDVVRDLVIALG
ncbi:helix-turn-helix domain-containing protein [Pedococcus aerophilus]|uniref:Helix-turn-helix domain-containing protein n=2 Tax=Pedococcus aerophilus TaxID=436356 RepID=A0ABN3V0J9_9MICO